MINNFKTYWLDFFSDNSIYSIEIEDDGILETIIVSSPNNSNKSRIELLIFIDKGNYQNMFDIRFYNPQLIGLTEMYNSDKYGFDGYKNSFEDEFVKYMTEMVSGFLIHGCTETSFSYKNQIFKYEYNFTRNNSEHKFIYSPKENNFVSYFNRFFNRKKINKNIIKIKNWC